MRDGLTADYVVVGAGAAGCALADKLGEDGRRTVLLLEAGPRPRHPLVWVPMGFVVPMRSARLTRTYVTDSGGRVPDARPGPPEPQDRHRCRRGPARAGRKARDRRRRGRG